MKHRCLFKGCVHQPIEDADFCWEHMHDKDGYRLKLVEASRTERSLAGYNLKKVNLSQLDLSGARLFDAKLEGADLVGTNLSSADITHCDMRHADLTQANLAGARLWNTDLTGASLTECDLSGADLWNAKLFNVKLWHATLAGAKAISRKTFSGGERFVDHTNINESGALAAEESYRNLKQYFISNGMYNDASWASFKEKIMERMILKKNRDLRYLPSLTMGTLCGYGEKPYRIVLSAALTICLFALAYLFLNAIQSTVNQNEVLHWGDCLYYSAITFTTVGYGDLIPKPHTTFRLLAAFEAFMGVFLTGLFIFTLARKYSAR